MPTQRKEKVEEYKIDVFKLARIQPIHAKSSFVEKSKLWLFYGSFCGQIILLILLVSVAPPLQLPHIFPLLISAFCCAHFAFFFLCFSYKQLFV